jgi:hypothetical protein
MKLRKSLLGLAVALFCAGAADAGTMRVVVVEATDVAGYLNALKEGQALLAARGSTAKMRVWRATFAGENAGRIVVALEFASLEELAKSTSMMGNDAQLKAWMEGLTRYRRILSDSIYEEMKP